MGQDIRDMIKGHRPEQPKIPKGHEARFEGKLRQAFQKNDKRTSFFWLKIAATAIIFLGAGYFAFQTWNANDDVKTELAGSDTVEEATTPGITLGDLSPDLEKIENFYTNGINVQLASLTIDDNNRELIDGYMKRLNELNIEYEKLNKELNEVGPTEATITALIDNLKLRLDLLFKLKNKLKELKQLENEQFSNITA